MIPAPSPQDHEEARWRAVLARDAAADGRFVYAVATTGIFCRPSCPARRPRRENVSFHPDAAAAARAGFRPCMRCRPDGPSHARSRAELIAEVCRRIEREDRPPTLAVLARAAGLSPSHLHRVFLAATGVTPAAWGAARLAARTQEALLNAPTVTAAMHRSGHVSSGRFYAATDRTLGMTPTRFRSGGAGCTIRFALGATSLGAVLVAATEKGACRVALGSDPDALLRELQERFFAAELVGGDAAFEKMVARVVSAVEAPHRPLDLPLDVRGTAFQVRVWTALRALPPGTTTTYAELARSLGAPRAVRAVASACAANELALAIPCHRVIRGDGGLGGYRWGIDRKRALLLRERIASPADETSAADARGAEDGVFGPSS